MQLQPQFAATPRSMQRLDTVCRALLVVLAFALALPTALAAQPPAQPGQPPAMIEIRGRIVDTAGAPIPNAAVSLRPKGSTVTIAGAMAGRDGQFRIVGLRPGTFSIRVAYLGYAPVIEDLTLTPDKPVVDLGVAKLAPIAMVLSDVTVEEERATVVTEPDRNTYTAKDIAPGASSNVDLGLSGSVTTAVSSADRYNTSGSIGYQSGPWTSFISAGLVSDARNAIGVNDRERYDAANALLSATSQDILLRPANDGQNLNVTVDYKLSARDVLSNALMVNRRSSEESARTTQQRRLRSAESRGIVTGREIDSC